MEVDEEQHLDYENSGSAVFNNFDLVVKILEEVTDDSKSNMELRLLNRTFRDAYHVILRRRHRNLKIEYIHAPSLDMSKTVSITADRIYINYCRFKISNLDNYFHFLRNSVKVKIDAIVVKDLWRLTPSLQASLHDSIRLLLIENNGDNLKKLIGMDEICHGNCEDCLWIPEKCMEYGPLGIENLQKSFTKSRVFETLIVPDYLLDDIANICVRSTQSKGDCLNAVSDFIPSNISCKTLILKISEIREEWVDHFLENESRMNIQRGIRMYPITDHQAMPREVIELMLKQWKVQSVVLKFVHQTHRNDYRGEWTRKDWLTKLCFKDPYNRIHKSDPSLKINEVFVDLTDSLKCNVHLGKSYVYGTSTNSYVHLPSKIRRVFLNDKLKIQFSHYNISPYSNIAKVARGMMKIINAEAPENLEVEITMYLVWKNDMDFLKNLTKQEAHLRPTVFRDFHISELSNRINISHKTLNRKDPQSYPIIDKGWFGRCFQLINKERNCKIKWTLFENENLLARSNRVN